MESSVSTEGIEKGLFVQKWGIYLHTRKPKKEKDGRRKRNRSKWDRHWKKTRDREKNCHGRVAECHMPQVILQVTLEQQVCTVRVHWAHGHFSSNPVNIFSLPWDFPNVFFSLAYCIVRIQYIIHITYKVSVGWLLMLLVRLSVNSRLFVVNISSYLITVGYL